MIGPGHYAFVEAQASREIGALLQDWGEGNRQAGREVISSLYPQLKSIAGSFLRCNSRWTSLQPHELVHELYVRLQRQRKTEWQSQAHFLNCCTCLMRQIATDAARAERAEKRGGQRCTRVPIDENMSWEQPRSEAILDIRRALGEAGLLAKRQVALLELRYAFGYTITEAAALLGVSDSTAKRDLALSHEWLQDRVAGRVSRPG